MDPVANPYTPGAGSRPPALVGRDRELLSFGIAVKRMAQGRPAKSQMITGLRGVGKTVLLREFGRTAAGEGWVHEQLEATEDLRFLDAIATLARKALLDLSARRRLADRARRAAGVLRAFRMRWKLPDGSDLEVEPVFGPADSGMLDDDLAGLFVELGGLARDHGTGVLFTIDEVQYLAKEHLAALIVGLHRVSQEQVPFMVAGAGLPSLPGLAGEAKSYAERLFDFPTIGSLSVDDATAALSSPAREQGVIWQPAAMKRVIALTEGYPYFLQQFGKQSWDVARGPQKILAGDVAAAIPIAMDELDTGFFRVRIDRTSDAERAYLRAMVSLGGPGPYPSGDVAMALGKKTNQVGPVRDSLIKRGLCYSPRWGEIAFTVPMFDQFIRHALV
jgi:AAA ATPase domain